MAAASPAPIPGTCRVLGDRDYLECERVKGLLSLYIGWKMVCQLVEVVDQAEKLSTTISSF